MPPDRLADVLSSLAQRRVEKDAEIGRRVAALETEAVEAEDKLKRLYRMVEGGVAELDDILRERIAALRSDRERAQAAADRIRPLAGRSAVSPSMLERFCAGTRFGRLPFTGATLVLSGHSVPILVNQLPGDEHSNDRRIIETGKVEVGLLSEGAPSL